MRNFRFSRRSLSCSSPHQRMRRRQSAIAASAMRPRPCLWTRIISSSQTTSITHCRYTGATCPIRSRRSPVWQFLGTDEDKESDLEGSAVVGSRIYWISSHGTNKNGKVQERRRRFFATEIVGGRVPTVTPVGKPYGLLVDDLAKLPSLA